MVAIYLNYFSKGYQVHGIKRRSSSLIPQNRSSLSRSSAIDQFHSALGDLTDSTSIFNIIKKSGQMKYII